VADADQRRLRENLLEQVRRNAHEPISDPVAEVLLSVPRHLFVPGLPVETAYQDDAIPTKLDGNGMPISSSSQPTIMALMLDQLGLAPGHRVLEIGAGTGYNAALMSRLVSPGGEVVSIDIDQDLVRTARENLARAGYPQVVVVQADGGDGFAAGAPYDRIIATVGVWDLAPAWLDQLAPDGRIVVPLDLGGVQASAAFQRADDHWVTRSVVPAAFMRLRGAFAGPERTHLLDRDNSLSIMVLDGADVDRLALLAALTRPPSRWPTRVTAKANQLFGGLGLWLTVSGSRWCILSESSSARIARLPAAPLRFTDRRYTAGILDTDGLAVLASEDDLGLVSRPAALGYGEGGDRLAQQLAEHVRAWDAAGRPGIDGLRIEAYRRSTPDSELPDRLIVDKRHTRLAVSWPAKSAP
jgi:protein-L-isoaspartate(D-aspartate) O-methyltransferase